MQKDKIELGDIFELEGKGCVIFLQCVEIPVDIENEVELIKVFYCFDFDKTLDLTLFNSLDFFFIRFPLKSAVKKKIVKKIGNAELPSGFVLPTSFRTTNFTGDAWQIVDAQTLKRITVSNLSEVQKKLSPWGMMNDTLIIKLLDKGWNLENWTFDNMWD